MRMRAFIDEPNYTDLHWVLLISKSLTSTFDIAGF
jgi:hypothetical protein